MSSLLGWFTSPAPLRRATALSLTERIGAAGTLISSLEYLTNESDRRWGGLNNWDVIRQGVQALPPAARKVLDLVADRRITRVLHAARVGAGLALLSPAQGRVRQSANLILSSTSLLLHPRHLYGTDGTDQVSFLVQTATTVARAGKARPELVDACLWYIAMQCALSYTASGWAKVTSPTWRTGRALPGVMRTRTYGDAVAWRTLQRYPRATKALGVGVLALECMFPLAYLAGGRLARPIVLSAAAFHLANARLMGLGRFVWAFGSMYPALLYTSGPRPHADADRQITDRRDDLLPAVCMALVAGSLGTALAASAARRRVVMRRRDGERVVTTSSGNRLSFRLTGSHHGDSPIVVLEHGLATTPELWEWVSRELSDRFPTVTYSRAGYGRSEYRAGKPYRLEIAFRDLHDLLDHVAGARRVVLVGHSLGGYLALQAGSRHGRVVGVGLVDPSHPAELQRSPRQAEGEPILTSTLALIPPSLQLGLGPLMRNPEWVSHLPEEVRALMLAQYRDSRLWAASRREWRATLDEFRRFDGRPLTSGVPLLIITAEQTALADPVQNDLHNELAKGAPWATRQTISGVTHEGILAERAAAGQVADLIAEFVGRLDTSRRAADDR